MMHGLLSFLGFVVSCVSGCHSIVLAKGMSKVRMVKDRSVTVKTKVDVCLFFIYCQIPERMEQTKRGE
jgi:hypothetical protein